MGEERTPVWGLGQPTDSSWERISICRVGTLPLEGANIIMTPAEQKKMHLRRYFAEIVSKGNLEAIPDFVAPDLVFWGPYTSEPIHGIKALHGVNRDAACRLRRFPDY